MPAQWLGCTEESSRGPVDHTFASLAEARTGIEGLRLDDNVVRMHSAHGGLSSNAVRLDLRGPSSTPTPTLRRPAATAGGRDPAIKPVALTIDRGPGGERVIWGPVPLAHPSPPINWDKMNIN